MTVHHSEAVLFEKARIIAQPLRRNRAERAFELHPGIHLALVASYFLFVAVLATAFGTAELAIPTAIFVIGIASLFITPAWWARTLPKDERPRQSWSEFMAEGVECNTGHLKAGEALAQILVLPALLVSLAMVMAVIKATL